MALPTGTVTFLFTDIEGSTQLLEETGEGYPEILAQHRRLLRDSWHERGGQEFGTQGDSFFVVFDQAKEAVASALGGQRALADHAWPDGREVRVRMGLHTGEPALTGEGYVGIDLHRAARICSAGNGGQVLLSRATRELLDEDLPDGSMLRDLGEHRLRGLTQPQRIYQLVAPGLPTDFPPLRTLDRGPETLPIQPTALVGREQEIEDAWKLLRRPNVRLLTLTGPGGTGKTRLALQVATELAAEFTDGVAWVELAPIADAKLVPATIGHALGLGERADEVVPMLKDHLRTRRLLIVLDNFEQVIGAGPLVGELLASAPGCKALVTSRTALDLSIEHELVVPSLSQYESVSLFAARARSANRVFRLTPEITPTIVEICVRLDCLPLAIELAAARSRSLSPQAILARLDQSLGLLTGGARDLPDRQRTLRGAIDWSYRLLTEPEQVLLARAAIFVGGFSLEAAERAFVGLEEPEEILDGLDSLVAKSLIRPVEGVGGEPRFYMLETIREYALERLEELGQLETMSLCHASHFLGLAEDAQAGLAGKDHARWLQLLDADVDNLRAALAWSLKHDEVELGLRLAAALERFWEARGHAAELRNWFEAAIPAAKGAPAPELAPALLAAGRLSMLLSDYPRAQPLLEEAVALYRETGDRGGLAAGLASLGWISMMHGDYDRARRLCEEATDVARELGDRTILSRVLNNLGGVLGEVGDHAAAAEVFQESLAVHRELGSSRLPIALCNLGLSLLRVGDYEEGRKVIEEAVERAGEMGDTWQLASTLGFLGWAALWSDRAGEAFGHFEESLHLRQELGERRYSVDCLQGLAGVAAASGDHARSARLWGAAEAALDELGTPLTPADRDFQAQFVELARAGLDETAWNEAFAEGRGTPLADAIAYALETTRETVEKTVS